MTQSLSSSIANPQHVAIIMDGNGRWAQAQGLDRLNGHVQGIRTLRKIMDAAKAAGVRYLTVYAFSMENWSRPEREVRGLMRLFRHFLKREIQDLIRKGVRLHIVGNAALFPDFVQPQLKEALEATKEQDALHLSLVMNYGSRTEVLDAVQSLLQDPPTEPLTWETFAQRLYTCHLPDPDLIIRTSGEMRISNFLMLQAAYAELYFTPIPWPDFSPADFEKALESYRQRTRRYGKTNEQILASAV